VDEPAVTDAICVSAVGGAEEVVDQFIAERTNVFGPGERAVRGYEKNKITSRKCSYCGAHFVEGWTVVVLDWGRL